MLNSKLKGNEAFQSGDYHKAISYYTEALKTRESLEKENIDERYKCLNNRSQCYLKIGDYENAFDDSNEVLKHNSSDLKALFRRSQASKGLNKYDEALIDAKRLVSYEPKNEVFINHMKSLITFVQAKALEQNSVKSKTRNMLDLAADAKGENQLNALNNLIVLARESDGANQIIDNDGLNVFSKLIEANDNDVKLGVIRILSTLCKNSFDKSEKVFLQLQFDRICNLIANKDEVTSNAVSLLIQHMLLSLSDLEEKRKTKKQVNAVYDFNDKVKKYINEIFTKLVKQIDEPSCSGFGRDNCIDLCLKYVDRAKGCGWTTRFLEIGLPKLLKVGSCVDRLSDNLPFTEHTKMHIACCLCAVYDDMYSDKERDDFISICDSYIGGLCDRNDDTSKLKAIACLAVILQGPFDVGNAIIGKHNLIDVMLNMADSGDLLQQKTAVEAVVFSASKKDKATGILDQGLDVLKKLYASNNQEVKVRALVGLCKLASSKGSDASVKILADGSILKLEKACTKLLKSPTADYDIKKWAADGLSYLTLDADVKEELINDADSIKYLFELAKRDDKNTLFSIATIFSNLCNAIEIKKPDPELLELAKYAKHHIPEEHEKDKEQYYKERRAKLMDYGIAQTLVAISKHDSKNCKELISSIFCILCKEPKNHGAIVACGGAKVLISLALDGSEIGKIKSAKALAEIAITMNPEIAFPGQRSVEVVRPLIHLLHPDRTGEENFKALMGLTNLAQVNSTVRKHIVKENGFVSIEHYMFDEHELLRRAATECMCNLVQESEVIERFAIPASDRVKLLVLYCGEDDLALSIAASGALSQLSADNEVICEKILAVESFPRIFKEAACVSNIDLQFRIFYILNNITSIKKEFCARIVETELMDVIIALTKLEVENERIKVKNLAIEIAKTAMENNFIKPLTTLYEDDNDNDG